MEWKRKEKTEIWWTLEELSYHWILGSIGDVSMPLLWGNWGSRRGIEATPPLERRRRCYAWVDCSCRSWYCVGFMMDIGFECRRSTTIKSGRRGPAAGNIPPLDRIWLNIIRFQWISMINDSIIQFFQLIPLLFLSLHDCSCYDYYAGG